MQLARVKPGLRQGTSGPQVHALNHYALMPLKKSIEVGRVNYSGYLIFTSRTVTYEEVKKSFKIPRYVTKETQWLATFALERNPGLGSLFKLTNSRNGFFKTVCLKSVKYFKSSQVQFMILGMLRFPSQSKPVSSVCCYKEDGTDLTDS